MSTATYYPNTSGGAGWYGSASDPPIGLANINTALSAADLDTMSADDANYVQTAGANVGYCHRIRFLVTQPEASVSQLDLTFKGFGAGNLGDCKYTVYIWNFTTAAWGAGGSHTEGTEQTVTKQIASGTGDYIDDSGYVYGLVQGPSGNDYNNVNTYFGSLLVTYTSVSTKSWSHIVG